MKNILRSLQIAVLVAMSALLFAGPVAAQDGGIGGRPANPQSNNVRSQSIFLYTLDKGASKQDAVLVANNSNTKRTVYLYATDAVLTNTGALSCKQEVEKNELVGTWVKLSQSQIELKPGESKRVPFTVMVPSSADVGEHNGCVVIQPEVDEGETQGNVRIRTRSAIRLAVTIPGDLKRDVTIKSFGVTKTDANQVFSLSVKNSGNVSADSINTVYLKSLFGTTVYENGGEYPIIAGSVMDLTFVNEKPPFWGGWYWAHASVSYDKRAGTFGTKDTSDLITKVTDRQLVFVVPSVGAILLLTLFGLIILAAIVYVIYRRDDRKITIRYSKIYTTKSGDAIKQVAKNHGVGWKDVATINQLKPPYHLEPGIKLFIPPARTKKPTKKIKKGV